jgi:hypothetical protein
MPECCGGSRTAHLPCRQLLPASVAMSSGGLPHKPLRPMDISKSMEMLPKLDGAPLPEWAKKSGGRSAKKSESSSTLPSALGTCRGQPSPWPLSPSPFSRLALLGAARRPIAPFTSLLHECFKCSPAYALWWACRRLAACTVLPSTHLQTELFTGLPMARWRAACRTTPAAAATPHSCALLVCVRRPAPRITES